MRILMLTDAFDIGGAETHILELTRALKAEGHEVTLLSNGGIYVKTLQESGIRHIRFRFLSNNPFVWLKTYLRLSRELKEGYDVIHAHTRKTAFFAARLARTHGIPLVTTAHWTFDTSFPKGYFTKWGTRTLAVSRDIRDYLTQNYGLYPDNIRVTVNGVSEESFYPNEKSLEGMPRRVITVSRLDTGRSKTAWCLLHIAERLLLRYPDFTLTLSGDGNELPALKKYAAQIEKKAEKHFIFFTGRITDVGALLRTQELFVGVSRAALEALFSGLPTILSGDEGYLSVFSAENADIAAETNLCLRGSEAVSEEKLYRDLCLLMDEAEAARKARRDFALDYVKKHYSVSRMASDALLSYKELASSSKYTQFPHFLKENADFLKSNFKNQEKSSGNLSKNPHREKSAVLLGYYGRKNLGDEATLRASIRFLRKCGYRKITVITASPREIMGREGVNAVSFWNIPHVLWEIFKNKTLFLGGGTLLQEKTSHRSLLYYLWISRAALFLRRRVVLLAGGIGALTPRGKKAVQKLLLHAEVSLRTPKDRKAAEALGLPPKKTALLPDLVFSLYAEYGSSSDFDTKSEKEAEACFARLFPASLPFWRKNPSQAQNADSLPKPAEKPYILFALRGSTIDLRLLSLIREETTRAGVTPLFAVLSPEDEALSRCYAANTAGYVTRLLTPLELLSLLPFCRYTVGNRLHFLIFSLLSGTPFIPISYDEKIEHFCDFVNYILQNKAYSVNSAEPSKRPSAEGISPLSVISTDSEELSSDFRRAVSSLPSKDDCLFAAQALSLFYKEL